MAKSPRMLFEETQEAGLAACASLSSLSQGRVFSETEDDYRTCFQRDRDRIMYTNAFKNLQFKTQVFVVHEGDYYRTRLAHTLEVMQHARTFARVLQANEDLVEAVALAHDLGHTPFGHAGEEILNHLLTDYGGFDHNLHSLRVVDQLEERYPEFHGLNLTWETREGLARHSTRYDHSLAPEEFSKWPQPGLEAQIVNLSDSLAFVAHDLDDALRVSLVCWDDLNHLEIPLIEQILREIKLEEAKQGQFPRQMREYRLIRHLIYYFNEDCILQSQQNLAELKPGSPTELRRLDGPVIALSEERSHDLQLLQNFLFDEVYKHPTVLMMAEKGKLILEKLFQRFWANPQLLPVNIRPEDNYQDETMLAGVIRDYLAGLTDRQAMDLYEMMFTPYTKVFSSGFTR